MRTPSSPRCEGLGVDAPGLPVNAHSQGVRTPTMPSGEAFLNLRPANGQGGTAKVKRLGLNG
jgi:hypothetical protein